LNKKSKIAYIAVLIILSLNTCVYAAAADTTASETTTTSETTTPPQKKKSKKFGHVKVNVLAVAASVLDVSQDELQVSLKSRDLGEILLEAGKLDAFKAAYLETAKTNLTAAVADGRLSQEQADEKYARVQTKIAAYDGTAPLFGPKKNGKELSKEKI
jgi:hypothetical protein